MAASLSPITTLWGEGWRRVRIAWWRWARHELQHKDPSHPDLPLITIRIRELQR